jgi:transketolase
VVFTGDVPFSLNTRDCPHDRIRALRAEFITAAVVPINTSRRTGIYGPDEQFPLGGCKVHHPGPEDAVTLVGAGVTLHECLTAADQLAADGINSRVIDLYSIKPIDMRTLLRSCQETGGRIVIAEDHYPEGGIGAAVLEALAGPDTPELHATLLAVKALPTSGTPQELLDAAGISARHITDAARNLLRTR